MLETLDRLCINAAVRIVLWKQEAKDKLQEWKEEERGDAAIVVQIILIGMVLVLGYIFREQIGDLFMKLWNSLVKFTDKPTDPADLGTMENPFGS